MSEICILRGVACLFAILQRPSVTTISRRRLSALSGHLAGMDEVKAAISAADATSYPAETIFSKILRKEIPSDVRTRVQIVTRRGELLTCGGPSDCV